MKIERQYDRNGRELRSMRKSVGVIYRVTCVPTGRVYIGKTTQVNPLHRWQAHLADARQGSMRGFQVSIREYGPENFVFEVIASALSRDHLDALELDVIAQYDADASGLNTEGPSAWKKTTDKMLIVQRSMFKAVQYAGVDRVIETLELLAAEEKSVRPWKK